MILRLLVSILLVLWRYLPVLEKLVEALEHLGWFKKRTASLRRHIETEKQVRTAEIAVRRRRKK